MAARALPIDYVNLRKRLNGVVPSTVAARPEFVEVLVAPEQSGACVEVLRVPLTGWTGINCFGLGGKAGDDPDHAADARTGGGGARGGLQSLRVSGRFKSTNRALFVDSIAACRTR